MATYFYGEDTFAARKAIQHLAEEQDAELVWVDGAELKDESLNELTGQNTGLFGTRLSVIRDPSTAPKGIQEHLAESGVPSGTLLWERVKTDKRSKLWRSCKDTAQEFVYPVASEVAQWIQSYVTERDGSISPRAAERLIARVGRDRWRLQSELDRLLLLSSDISEELIEQETDVDVEAEIFSTLDAVVAGRQADAIAGVEALLAAGNSELYILSMLSYQFRNILVVLEGLAVGKTEGDIARNAKLHPFVVKKSIPVARQYSRGRVTAALTRITATDFAIKQGKVDARTGLTMLVLTLSKST